MEVEDALIPECGLVVKRDVNLWAGPKLVPGDPNKMNNNGQMFRTFLEKYSHLTVVNESVHRKYVN